MPPEVPKQFDMFSEELQDTRTRQQKRRDVQQSHAKQQAMFRQGEVAQFGLTTRPQLSLAPKTRLILMSEDPRSQAEQERDAQQQASEQTPAMFSNPSCEATKSSTIREQERTPYHTAELEVARQRKVGILEQWQRLPLSEQAALLVELMPNVLTSDRGAAVRQALELAKAETIHQANQPIPISWVHRDDLIACRPDRVKQIQKLDQSEIARIADKVGDALTETYWLAMEIILDKYLSNTDVDSNEEPEQ